MLWPTHKSVDIIIFLPEGPEITRYGKWGVYLVDILKGCVHHTNIHTQRVEHFALLP